MTAGGSPARDGRDCHAGPPHPHTTTPDGAGPAGIDRRTGDRCGDSRCARPERCDGPADVGPRGDAGRRTEPRGGSCGADDGHQGQALRNGRSCRGHRHQRIRPDGDRHRIQTRQGRSLDCRLPGRGRRTERSHPMPWRTHPGRQHHHILGDRHPKRRPSAARTGGRALGRRWLHGETAGGRRGRSGR